MKKSKQEKKYTTVPNVGHTIRDNNDPTISGVVVWKGRFPPTHSTHPEHYLIHVDVGNKTMIYTSPCGTVKKPIEEDYTGLLEIISTAAVKAKKKTAIG